MADLRDTLGADAADTSGAGARTDRGGQSADPSASQQSHLISPPAITLPKGGGAIRGIGEKFAANPVTGTGAMTLPIATSPGRGGFGPQLSLSYDSGSGNGPFGFGWGLSLPSITRKTDKGLPQYRDADESDVFILSGAEDLVPVPAQNAPTRTVNHVTYRVDRYRPRIEGLFARIERWTNLADATDVFWRSISSDNITTWFGKTANSHIADPGDPSRIFSWLICQSHDDKGNVIVYGYKPEDSARIFEDAAGKPHFKAHECNRTDSSRSAQRYLKRIRYGNRSPYLPTLAEGAPWPQPPDADAPDGSDAWHFEVVFDYGEHDADAPLPTDASIWPARLDPFSSYRAGFEIRTYRICQRVLMFHHFPGEDGVGRNCLVRSTDLTYSHEQDPANARNPVYTFLREVTQSGYQRLHAGYLKRSLPAVAFHYTLPEVQDRVQEVDGESLENLPMGLDGSLYQWMDLHGEGIPGILTEQAGAWLYKRNLSPISERPVEFAPLEVVPTKPNLSLTGGQAQLMDLAGDGQPDLVALDGPMPGLYEHDGDEGWEPFRPFRSRLTRDMRDPNLKLVDLTGDGHADVLISEDDAFVWHASLAEAGFGPARRVQQLMDEEQGPRLVFADGTQSIHVADLSGDGLQDLVRIRNGEVCYWPNLGYCRFGAKVSMDRAPQFDHPDQFDHQRIRLADIDGTGTTDILYLHRDGVRLYFNQSGNSWSPPRQLDGFPAVDDLAGILAVDLRGNGTACLVWSSPLPGDAVRPMRYLELMGQQKPHLLWKTVNNLGAETRVQYAPSTKFYLQDKRDGSPWITRLPFPVHVVERVETIDHISGNRFTTRYAYHHGHFDGEEREFRGFGMVEQWDTDQIGSLGPSGIAADAAHGAPQSQAAKYAIGQVATCQIQGVWQFTFRPIVDIRPSIHVDGGWYYFFDGVRTGVPEDDVLLLEDAGRHARGSIWDGTPEAEVGIACSSNGDPSSHLPPVHTKTWFHTGVYLDRQRISRQHAREYHGAPAPDDPDHQAKLDAFIADELLPDTILPDGLTLDEEREACRALKGMMLRQEVYADDGSDKAPYPYSVTEQSFTVRHLQPKGDNRHAVFFAHAREAISYQYERNPADPRIQHALTLEVDNYGNVLKQAAIGYGRRASPLSTQWDRDRQTTPLLTYTENRVTKDHDTGGDAIDRDDEYRVPLTCEAVTFELTGYTATGAAGRFRAEDFVEPDPARQNGLRHKFNAPEVAYEASAAGARRRRPIEWLRTLYRRDDLSDLLPLGDLQPLALPGESYKLAFTPGLLASVFRPRRPDGTRETLVSPQDAPGILGSQGDDGGGYLEWDGHWWLPSGQVFYHKDADPADPAATAVELAEAVAHFYLPRKYTDPFGHSSTVDYGHDLLVTETRDACKNRVQADNDYRVLQPAVATDPNGNRSFAAFDALGLLVATAVAGKPGQHLGDLIDDFTNDASQGLANPTLATLQGFVADPRGQAAAQLRHATTRILYDLDRYHRCGQPPFAATLARQTHVSDLNAEAGQQTEIQIGFSYSDGFGREIQKKIQAEAGSAPQRQVPVPLESGDIRPGELVYNGQEKPRQAAAQHRWVGNGRTVFNNKGKPVRQYEPFFSATHLYEPERDMTDTGVSPVLFYDPVGRVIATLHPSHTYEKVVFDPWTQTTYDVNDTVAAPAPNVDIGDPRTDAEIAGYVRGYFKTQPAGWQTWYERRINGPTGDAERDAAAKAALHADTPTTAHLDALGRPFLTLARNRFERNRATVDETYPTRVLLDIEGNEREVRDAIEQEGDPLGRVVMRYDYDMLGNRIHQASMEAGARWMLNDVAGNPIRAWDSRGHNFKTKYDVLRRPLNSWVEGTDAQQCDPRTLGQSLLVEKIEYGEDRPDDVKLNLRTRVFKQYDGAGVVTNQGENPLSGQVDAYDFKGNPLCSTRQLVWEYKDIPNWSQPPVMEQELFTCSTRYDALNRPTELIAPHSNTFGTKTNRIRHSYNAANLLEAVWANLGDERDALGNPVWTPFFTNIDYNAKGQRELIEYGSGATPGRQAVRTAYSYDPDTFRLTRLLTTRGNQQLPDCTPRANPRQCEDPPAVCASLSANRCVVQDLSYTYDPAGNITRIRDDAQQPIFFKNAIAEPANDYTYDAIYRLIEATGREHLGQAGAPIRHSYNDAGRSLLHPNDRDAMGRYCETYVYDAVGNILEMGHGRNCTAMPGWTRTYSYDEASLLENGKRSNRLTGSSIGGIAETYSRRGDGYDAHGNMLRMPQLQVMEWDFQDQLRMTQRQQVNNDRGEKTYYVYDA